MPHPEAQASRTLTELVRARATTEGRTVSALPGLWFFRWDTLRPMAAGRSTTMHLAVAVQGRKRVQVGGRLLHYDAHHYLVQPGETDYEACPVVASPEAPYLALAVQLPPSTVVQALVDLAEGASHGVEPPSSGRAATEPTAAFTTPLDLAMTDALCRLVRAADDPLERRMLAPLVLSEIVFRLLRTPSAEVLRRAVSRSDTGWIQRAIAFIDANAERPLTVAAIARHVAMSPSHFAHRFREAASMSPMRYQKHVQLARARDILLLSAGQRVGDVASRVGYASAAHFTRDFKRHFGLPPRDYVETFHRGAVHPAPHEADGPAAAAE